jgi:hypothetical protein
MKSNTCLPIEVRKATQEMPYDQALNRTSAVDLS